MAAPMKAGLAPDLVIGQGYIIRLTAISPTTGAVVAGVSISNASVFATHLGGPIDDLVPMPMLVPSDQIV